MKKTDFDVAVIGAGIIGSCIARRLSKTNAGICLIEKENDVSCGSSKANSGIVHAGYDPVPGTLMARLNVQGAELYPELSAELNFDYKRIGSLVVAFDGHGRSVLNELLERGNKNKVPELRIIEREELCALEPHIGSSAVAALYAPTAGIMNPYKATWAFAESAVINGVKFMRSTAVFAIEKTGSGFLLHTGRGDISARFVVNAAGTAADAVSRMAGARKFAVKQRRGEYMLFDSNCGSLVNHVLFQTPSVYGKGVLVTRTVDGNLLAGPSADEQRPDQKDYTGTTAASQTAVFQKALVTVPDIPRGSVITSFAGIRTIAYTADAAGNPDKPINDFIIEEDENVRGFINAAGICSPGLSAAPAAAEYVYEILCRAGLNASARSDFIKERAGIPDFKNADAKTKQALIKKNPLYGQIICRCETITEGEIVDAIKSPLGAIDLDGVKRRTRAGMGRCQGGFCSPRVTEIIARETGIPMTSVTKNGGPSYILDCKTRACAAEHSVEADR